MKKIFFLWILGLFFAGCFWDEPKPRVPQKPAGVLTKGTLNKIERVKGGYIHLLHARFCLECLLLARQQAFAALVVLARPRSTQQKTAPISTKKRFFSYFSPKIFRNSSRIFRFW